jgi:hypothetical protein
MVGLDKFPVLVSIGYSVSARASQAADLLGSVLQLQYCPRATVPSDCGHQLHQFLHPEQGLPLN